MSVINILAPHVADMIAAGEVVERPGSVIKELMENAVDAGAKNITVELRGGGATYIRVTDDGCGMAPEDAANCFLRHATSKLRDERGLEAIETMGFRGEALAAISAVSRIELATRQASEEAGTLVEVAGGDVLEVRPTGCPVGTAFTVRDLFYNTPARLKFMKSDRAESAFCVQQALRVALGRPDVSVRCLRDGREEFFTSGDCKAQSAVYALLGRDIALSMLPVKGENEGVRVTGFVSSPAAGRGNRAMQYFFVNGRAIRSQILQAAVEQAYKNTLLVGRFPACVLYIDLNPGSVDVNVHPTKNEVKFSGEKKVFDAVHYSVLNALHGESRTLEMSLSKGTEKKLAPQKTAAPEPVSKAEAPANPKPEQLRMNLQSSGGSYSLGVSAVYHAPAKSHTGPSKPVYQETGYHLPASRPIHAPDPGPAAPDRPPKPAPAVQSPVTPPKPAPAPEPAQKPAESLPARLVGEVLHTYIIAEQGDRVLLIDKHAAHERMIFDRLKARGQEIMSQSLLVPEPWHPSPEELETLDENAGILSGLGFELEAYGEGDVIIRGVPDAMDPAQAVPALEDICQKLRRGGGDLARDEILQTISCKAAIKAGWDTDPLELQVLADKVVSGEIRYCPHGRPVAVSLTRKELDKQFKRIV